MDPMSNHTARATLEFFERNGWDVNTTVAVLIAILLIAVATMVDLGCQKGSDEETVTRF